MARNGRLIVVLQFLVEAATITLLATGVFHCFAIALGAPFFTFVASSLFSTPLLISHSDEIAT